MHSFTFDSGSITKYLHAALSWAVFFHSSSRPHLYKSSIIISSHLFLWPPTDLLPLAWVYTWEGTWVDNSPPFFAHVPCSHLNLLCMIIISALSRPPQNLNSVFLILSRHDTPKIIRRHPMMKAWRCLKQTHSETISNPSQYIMERRLMLCT